MKTARYARSRHGLVLGGLGIGALAALLGSSALADAAPANMSRDQILSLGKTVVGYSYWWGHGRWRTDGASHGSCSGGCPGCSHKATGSSGEYGADCSGFVAKAWQVPSPIAVTTDAHPYSTWSFMGSSSNWNPVSRGSALPADAFVYNNGSAGHIFLYVKGDPWGTVYAYECKGCSAGCVYNSRGTSGYSVRRRINITNIVDTDGDGVSDDKDNCDTTKNADQKDTDKDKKGDACDTDDDNDGDLDTADNCPLVANADQKDTDKDKKGDACDTDDDNDGVADGKDNCPVVANKTQADLDKDGKGDACDDDTDGDKIVNGKDNCPVVSNADQADKDKDGKGDACDGDDDGDGIPDEKDNCKGFKNPDQSDIDKDGKGDDCDDDADGDGIVNAKDNCPLDKNADQLDTDKDGKGNACDDDADGDGKDNDEDNCPVNANPDQEDSDDDGKGDDCDTDSDGDGVLNDKDNCPTIANPAQEDDDKDGTGNACSSDGPGDPGDLPEDDAGVDGSAGDGGKADGSVVPTPVDESSSGCSCTTKTTGGAGWFAGLAALVLGLGALRLRGRRR